MLVIDLVELISVDRLEEVRKLDGDDAGRGEQDFHSPDEIIQVGDLGEHVVAEYEVGLLADVRELTGGVDSKKFHQSWDALGFGHLRHVGGGLDTESGNPALHEVLEEVSIVAGDLDDPAFA